MQRLLATISDLRARNEALTAELESAKRNSYSYTAARLVEAESTIARHVAAMQEIGCGVEADQATIARLSEELAQADAVIAREWQNNSAAHDPRDDATIVAAIERHRARAPLSPLPTQEE